MNARRADVLSIFCSACSDALSFTVNLYNDHDGTTTPKCGCIDVMRLSGHKTVLWKEAVIPPVATHVLLMDEDIDILGYNTTYHMDLMSRSGARILQPHIDNRSSFQHLRKRSDSDACRLRCTNMVEVMAPLMTRGTFHRLRTEILPFLPEANVTVWGIDELWCTMFGGCAVSGRSVRHFDLKTMNTQPSLHRAYSDSARRLCASTQRHFVLPSCVTKVTSCKPVQVHNPEKCNGWLEAEYGGHHHG